MKIQEGANVLLLIPPDAHGHLTDYCRGGDLGGLGGRFPPKILGAGDGPCIRPPNILRSSVVGCARKNEQSKNGVIKEFFSEIVVVHVRKGSYTTLNIVKDMENPGKGREILKTWSMTKKGHQKFWPGKCTFFSEKNVIQKSWSPKKNFRPPKLGARSPPLDYCILNIIKAQ